MFESRSYEAELMDDFSGFGKDWAQTLDELEIINRFLGGYNVTLDALGRSIHRRNDKQPITIADLGCGGGDSLRVMAKWFRKKEIKASLTGIDANEFVIQYAENKSKGFPELDFIHRDIFSNDFKASGYDIIACSLFCHHFTEDQLIDMFSKIKERRSAVIINDLHRHPLAYYSIKLLVKFFSRSPLVKNDGPLSVRRAFKKHELENILEKAGIENYSIRWMWAFRWQVIF
ncbi:MAG: methyltransferase domain-containing protein [Bacteroidota bacterium]|nr:methyltransferase domain-containing protein [Bacteroidota bacterium]